MIESGPSSWYIKHFESANGPMKQSGGNGFLSQWRGSIVVSATEEANLMTFVGTKTNLSPLLG